MAFIGDESGRKGIIAAIAAGLGSSATVYAANALSPKFRAAFSASSKAALIVTPTAGAFFVKSHLTVAEARADPESFVGTKTSPKQEAPSSQSELFLWQRAANAVYFNPVKVISAIALPFYSAVFYAESTNPGTASMPLSQRIIHTRVYGQMIAVLATAAVFGFVNTMDADGPYRIENSQVVRGMSKRGAAIYDIVTTDAQLPSVDGASAKYNLEVAARRGAARRPAGLLVPLTLTGLRNRLVGVLGVLAHAGNYMHSCMFRAVRAAQQAMVRLVHRQRLRFTAP